MKVWHSTPWATGNIGAGLNAFCALVPDDDWICLRDGDTLFLSPEWGRQIEAIIAANPDHAVIGAMTNRLRAPYQLHRGEFSDNPDIGYHRDVARQRWAEHGTAVADVAGPVAGMCLIFPKCVWRQSPFVERSIYFDQVFCAAARSAGGRIGVAQGLYLLHLYRWGQADPCDYTEHLLCK